MKDNLALLAEGAEARVIALDSAAASVKQHAELSRLTVEIQRTLKEIDRRHRNQASKSNQISLDLQKNFERCILTLGITHSQEDELAEMLQDAANRARLLYDEGLEIGTHMSGILKQLEQTGS
jgi:ribosomal protein L1